ncbi:non-canonical ubiquitin conjugating enzyme 1 [Coprinopsis sp. MPI-PUGE-AT-0042]|nr:non-canonical ubiquitin conjugating enzyme 1 [Coprinopsis sp. MPI-PUGE-AT-0042]
MPPQALNKNNSAVKRIMQEARELANDPSTDYHAAPLEDDIFEWHCTLRGPAGTEFEGGLYHFRILLPAEYPFRPPSIMMLTPSGRFEVNTKICISFTSYHEELWQPAWGVRTAIIGLQGFFPLKGQAAVGVGSIESHTSERKRLATLSKEWTCPDCKTCNSEILPDPSPAATASPPTESLLTPEPDLPPSEEERQKVPIDASVSQRPIPDAAAPATVSDQSPNAETPTVLEARTASPEQEASSTFPRSAAPSRSQQKPPVLLDTAIMILFVLLFAIICRRIV